MWGGQLRLWEGPALLVGGTSLLVASSSSTHTLPAFNRLFEDGATPELIATSGADPSHQQAGPPYERF